MIFLIATVIFQWIAIGYLFYRLNKVEVKREVVYAAIADADKIADDMEKSAAYVDQMLAPRRTTKPRDDQQGPPAVVHKPKRNGALPHHLKKTR